MSHAPSTLGTMTTSSLSPTSVIRVVRSSSTQGLSRELIRVQRAVSPKSVARATLTRPSRAATFLSTGTASSRLPRRMSACLAMSGTLAAIFSLEASKKWIILEGPKGISVTGSGAPIARGRKNSLGFLMAGNVSVRPGAGSAGRASNDGQEMDETQDNGMGAAAGGEAGGDSAVTDEMDLRAVRIAEQAARSAERSAASALATMERAEKSLRAGEERMGELAGAAAAAADEATEARPHRPARPS